MKKITRKFICSILFCILVANYTVTTANAASYDNNIVGM